ncbi:MAG: CHASE domain-containing protein, partial [Myxococcota bacterium]
MPAAGPDAAHPPLLTLRRMGPVLLAVLVCSAVWAGLFGVVREREREQIQREFERAADDLEVPLRTRIDANLDALHSIGRLHAASDSVAADEFAQFTATVFASHPGLRALAWVPRVGSSPGDAFPIRYVAPFEERRSLVGLDLGTDAGSLAAMEAARDGAAPVASPPPTFPGDGESLGYFVFLPLYATGRPHETREER